MTIRIRSQEWAAIICMSCVYDMYVYVRVNMYNVHDLPKKETATTGTPPAHGSSTREP